MPSVTDQAVCIRQWDWSETSQTVSLLCRRTGLLRGIAKGAKREKAPFSGGLEVLTVGEVVALVKPSAELATICSWDLQETFPALRRSLRAHYAGMYLADLVHHTVHERDPHPALFDAMLRSLRALEQPGEAAWGAVLRFQWATLVETGYRPELDADAAGGGSLPDRGTHGFSPRLGGLTAGPQGAGGPVWGVREETVRLLRRVAAGDEEALGAASSHGAIVRSTRLLGAYLREIVGRELPSEAYLFGAG